MSGRTGSRFRATQGLDRLGTAMKAATSSYSKALVVGDITAGTVVEVDFAAADNKSVDVGARRTGAILINSTLPFNYDINWTLDGSTLEVDLSATLTGTAYFWVF